MADYQVNAGAMRTLITFQAPTISKDTGAAQSETWANVASNPTVWSKWTYDHGQEVVDSDAAHAVARATVEVRYRSDILSTWSVLQNGARWKIIGPPENVQNLNRWCVFRVERIVGTL